MKVILSLILLIVNYTSFAQVDTVVVVPNGNFVSNFSKKLNFERQNIKYTMQERGNVRDVFVYLSCIEELANNKKTYAIRIDNRLNRNIFSDAPLAASEYIDADEIPVVIGYLDKIINEIMPSDHNAQHYTEYRFYTRGGIMLEAFTGTNRWRFCLNYKTGNMAFANALTLDKPDNFTFLSRIDIIKELREVLVAINKEITEKK